MTPKEVNTADTKEGLQTLLLWTRNKAAKLECQHCGRLFLLVWLVDSEFRDVVSAARH
jgi:hypothetical protein